MDKDLLARLEALEFAVSLGMLTFAQGWYANTWDAENLPKRLRDLAEVKGAPQLSEAAWDHVRSMAAMAEALLQHTPSNEPPTPTD